jgi:dUTP pyrophosphatase
MILTFVGHVEKGNQMLDSLFNLFKNVVSLNDNTFKIVLDHEFARMPVKAHATDAGWDLCSCEHVVIQPKQWIAVNTGLKFIIPQGWEVQIRPRSGLAAKKGITVLNTPGTIDQEYRGFIKVILYNAGEYPFDIHPGDRIAQAVMCPVFNVTLEQIDELPSEDTSRGSGGFGSTGK